MLGLLGSHRPGRGGDRRIDSCLLLAQTKGRGLWGRGEYRPLEEILPQLPLDAVPLYFREARFYLSHVEDGLLALYRKCPHLGCVVPWNYEEDQFHCPCHSSLFNRKGEWQGGPAPRLMDLMRIDIRNGEIWVDTGDVRQRAAYDLSQAVPI